MALVQIHYFRSIIVFVNVIILVLFFQYLRKDDPEEDDLTYQMQKIARVQTREVQNNSLVKDKIFWTPLALSTVPKGHVIPSDDLKLRETISSQPIVRILNKTFASTSELSRTVFLQDGTRLAGRYTKYNVRTRMHGEVLAYHMSVLLGYDNSPIVILAQYNRSSSQWRQVSRDLDQAEWKDGTIVPLIEWREDLAGNRSEITWHKLFLDAWTKGHSITGDTLHSVDKQSVAELIQWSDLMVLDYIIVNLDRLTFNNFWVDYYKDNQHMQTPIRNIGKVPQTGKFWTFDNEFSMFEGVKYMTTEGYKEVLNQYFWRHERIIRTLCVFRKETIDTIRKMSEMESVVEYILNYVRKKEPLYLLMEETNDIELFTRKLFDKWFKKRLKYLISWVELCKQL